MALHLPTRLAGALAIASLAAAACAGSTPTAKPTTAAVAPVVTPLVTSAPPTTTPVATLGTIPPFPPGQTGPNGRIAYGVKRSSGFQIYSSLADGTDERQLTNGTGSSLCAAYAPDGKSIAYCSDTSGDFEIWTMQADGSKPTQLTHLKGRVLFPDVSPDGKEIAFAGVVGTDAHTEVYVVDAATGEGLVALTSCKGALQGCSNDYPAWSPDGKSILFIHQDDSANDTGINEQVWVMKADGSGARALTSGDTPKDQLPNWSPDGSQIVYAAGTAHNEGIWVMQADGSGQHQLSGCVAPAASPCAVGNDWAPVWSPDGLKIAFLHTVGTAPGDRPVVVMNAADGSDRYRLIAGPYLQAAPAWQSLASSTGG